MPPPRSTAAHASIAYLRIDGFGQKAVAEQVRLKARFEAMLEAALASLKAHERIVLDAPEGAAVVVLGNPGGALRFAWAIGGDRELPIAVGLAHGAVRVAQGTPASIYGDALAAAEVISASTSPGGASASREFRDALAESSPGLARQLSRAGSAVDAQDRALEMFRADRESCASNGRRFFAIAGGVAAVIVALGIGARFGAEPPASAPTAIATKPGAPKPIARARPATITFDIRPEGDIFVNGTLKGKSPPLRQIQLPAGRHQIEIRSGKHKPLATELVVAEGEELAVQHSFVSAQPAKPFYKRWIDKAEKALK